MVFLAADASSEVLATPLPPATLAQRSNELHKKFDDTAALTWRVLLAAALNYCWSCTVNSLLGQACCACPPGAVPQPQALALLASTAAWPLEGGALGRRRGCEAEDCAGPRLDGGKRALWAPAAVAGGRYASTMSC